MRRVLLVPATVLAVLAMLAPGTPALAHAQLLAADPAKDAVLTAAPATVTLRFNERLNPDFITIVVSDPGGRRVAASDPVVDNVRSTITLTGPPANGVHTVAYRVVSVDGHTVQGSYTFTLADPALPAAVAPAQASTEAAPVADSGGLSTAVILGLAGGGLILTAAVAWLFLTGRRRAASST